MTSTGFQSPPFARSRGALLRALAGKWHLFLLRGVLAILFGVLALTMPGLTVLTLVLLWGVYALIDGGLSVWAAVTGKGASGRWWLLVVGAAGVLAGVFALLQPGVAALALLMIIGIWSLVVGVMQIVGALRLRKEIDGEWWLLLGGVANVVFGALLVAQPAAGTVAVAWLLGIFAIVVGVAYVLFALRLRKHHV